MKYIKSTTWPFCYNRGELDLACKPTADRQLCIDALFVVIKQSRHPALEFKDRTPRSEPFIAVHPPNSEIHSTFNVNLYYPNGCLINCGR